MRQSNTKHGSIQNHSPICNTSILHQSNANPHQSTASNLGTSLVSRPTEVSRRSTIKTINFRSDATPVSIRATGSLHSVNPRPISISFTNSPNHCQSKTNLPIQCQPYANPWRNKKLNFTNLVPIRDQSANPSPVHRYWTHLPIFYQYSNLWHTYISIQRQSANIFPSLSTLRSIHGWQSIAYLTHHMIPPQIY